MARVILSSWQTLINQFGDPGTNRQSYIPGASKSPECYPKGYCDGLEPDTAGYPSPLGVLLVPWSRENGALLMPKTAVIVRI